MSDNVNSPAHYRTGKIEVIEFIEDQEFGFNLENAVKYIARAGKKDPAKLVEDLKKAEWYVAREIKRLTAKASKIKCDCGGHSFVAADGMVYCENCNITHTEYATGRMAAK